MIDAELNLDPKSLAAACKGNTKLLPSFVVHDDDAPVISQHAGCLA